MHMLTTLARPIHFDDVVCVVKASADFSNVSQLLVDILSNDEVLAISDDSLGAEAIRLGDEGRVDASAGEIYVGQISNGGYAVVFFNRGWQPSNMTFVAADVTDKTHAVRDLWTHTDNGTLAAADSMDVVVQGMSAVMVTLNPL